MSKEDSKTKKIYKILKSELENLKVDFDTSEEENRFCYNIEEEGCLISYFIDIDQDNNYIQFSSIHIVSDEERDYVKGIIGANECNNRLVHGGIFIGCAEDKLSVEYSNCVPYLESDLGGGDISMLIKMSYRSCSDCIDAVASFMCGKIDHEGFMELLDSRMGL